MLARFSVAYERFCRLLVAIFVVNVAILAHTLMGAVVLGFLPSFAAAQATFRAWLLSEDCSMRAKEVWKTFHGFWKSEVKRANLFGWPLVIFWAVVIVDYYVMNWHARGDFDIMVSGVLLLIIVVLQQGCDARRGQGLSQTQSDKRQPIQRPADRKDSPCLPASLWPTSGSAVC